MIVADTNLVAYLFIPGANSVLSEEVLMRDAEWATPVLCRSELRNVLALYMRHQGMSLMQAQQTMDKAERFLEQNEFTVPSDAILQATSKCHISAYDAEFVVLAEQLHVPLVTSDKDVLRAFPRLAVSPAEFIANEE